VTFPTTKSDPYAKGAKRRRPRFQLWSEAFWSLLTRLCDPGSREMSERQLTAINDENKRLYGGAR